MKVKVTYDSDFKCLKVPIILKAPRKRIISEAVFDTGSPYTLLNYSDSIRLGIPHNIKSEFVRIGGRSYQSYLYERFEITFKSEDGEIVTELLPIRVLRPTSIRSEELEKLDRFPNIFGLDFLGLGYKFFCDLKTGEVYFEK
jgi:hypothetical protein